MNAKDYASKSLNGFSRNGMGPQNLYKSMYSVILDLALNQVLDKQKQVVEQEVLATLTHLGFDATVIKVKTGLNSDRQEARDELLSPLLESRLRQMVGKAVDEAMFIAENCGYRLEVLTSGTKMDAWGENQTGWAIAPSNYDPNRLDVVLDESGNVAFYDYPSTKGGE